MRVSVIGACFVVIIPGIAFGQPAAPSAFEVASVRRANPQTVGGGLRGGPGTDDPGRIAYSNMPLVSVLINAYHVQPFQISGPDWLKTERYDIAAKIPEGVTQSQYDLMLQILLAERFHLVLHHETRDFRAYELVAGKNGPKLKESVPNTGADQAIPPALKDLAPATRSMVLAGMPLATSTGVLMAGRGRFVKELVEDLSLILGAPVVDRTGLAGKYDYTLEFERPQGVAPSATAGTAPGDSPPTVLTAVQEQLGLKLEEKKLPFDVLVVDRAEKYRPKIRRHLGRDQLSHQPCRAPLPRAVASWHTGRRGSRSVRRSQQSPSRLRLLTVLHDRRAARLLR